MSSAEAQVAYNNASFQPREPAQDMFAQQFDLGNPEQAMSSYQKLMHQHTKQQFEMTTTASSRRSTSASIDQHMPSLSSTSASSPDRSRGSVSSAVSS